AGSGRHAQLEAAGALRRGRGGGAERGRTRALRARGPACRPLDVGRLAAPVRGVSRRPTVSFDHPYALLALLLVPVLVWLWLVSARRRRRSAAAFTTLALLPNLVDRSPGRLRAIPAALFLVALAALVVGFARPHARLTVPRHEATVVLAIDV